MRPSCPWPVARARTPLPSAPSCRTTPPPSSSGESCSVPLPPQLPTPAARDVRAAPTARAHYDQAHSDDVTVLAFHPSDPALLLSGSTDGLVSLHDTRIVDEDDLTLQTLNHGASIHHAGFLTDSLAFALSHDERFALYDIAHDGHDGHDGHDAAALTNLPSGDLRAVLGCQYVADVTPKTDGSGAIIGAGSQEYV